MNSTADQLIEAMRILLKDAKDDDGCFIVNTLQAEKCEALLAAYDATPNGHLESRPRIGIKMEGGVIQNVFADTDASIYIINYDTEDASPPHGYEDESHALCQLEQDGGGTVECVLSRYGAEISPIWFARMDSAISARVSELDEAEEDSEAPRP